MSFNEMMLGELKKFVSQRLPAKEKEHSKGKSILQDTACMDPKLREYYGYLDAFIELTGFQELKILLPVLQKLGRTQWYRDILSDMGMFIGESEMDYLDLEKAGIIKG